MSHKFYSISLALGVFALSASAAAPMTIRGTKVNKIVTASEVAAQMKQTTPKVALQNAPARAADYSAIAGNYIATLDDVYFQDGMGRVEEDATIELSGNFVIIDCAFFSSAIEAQYDSSNGKITFQTIDFGKQTLSTSGGQIEAYVRFEPFAWNATTSSIEAGSYDVTYDPGTLTISFPADHGFSWVVYEDEACTSSLGYMNLFDVISLAQEDPNKDPNEGWKEYGTAKLQDGWVLPLFGMDQTLETNQWEVLVQQNIENNNIYRLVDPYHGESPVAEYNASSKVGYIEFDVTDPDHVLVTGNFDSGFSYPGVGLNKMYCNNYLQFLASNYSMTPGEVIEILGDDPEMLYTTYKDNVVLLPSKFVDDANGYLNDAMFGMTGPGGYGWQSQDGAATNMESKIFMPSAAEDGIDGIVSDSNAPVRYFNLQGVEVSSPAKGELVIKTQGGKAVKTIVR